MIIYTGGIMEGGVAFEDRIQTVATERNVRDGGGGAAGVLKKDHGITTGDGDAAGSWVIAVMVPTVVFRVGIILLILDADDVNRGVHLKAGKGNQQQSRQARERTAMNQVRFSHMSL